MVTFLEPTEDGRPAERRRVSRDPSVAVASSGLPSSQGPPDKIVPKKSAPRKPPPTTSVLRAPKAVWKSRDPTADYSFQTSRSNIKFQSLDDNLDGGAFQKNQNREIEYSEFTKRELPETSRLSHAITISSTLPMAQDNDRFFGQASRYKKKLDEAYKNIQPDKRPKDVAEHIGFFGWLWRWVIRAYIALTNDPINRLRYTRAVQVAIPFQSTYESFILGALVGAFDLDSRRRDGRARRQVFSSRNGSRVMVQAFPVFDRLWHLSTQITWNRLFDFISLIPILPIVGQFGFPGTENNNGSRDFAISAILRPFFEGSFITRSITGNQQGLVTLDKNTPAQNLAAEATGLEIANRNQLGTWFGRMKTNEFRLEHRLPTDESIVRTFIASPGSTMVNNGFEHVMGCVAGHWKNMLFQENGNFGHQRQEQLEPFQIMRFHMPIVLMTLSNLRGRNTWDSRVLGPFMRELQSFNPAKCMKSRKSDEEHGKGRGGDYEEVTAACDAAKKLLFKLRDEIIPSVCAGIMGRVVPFTEWVDALIDSCDQLQIEAEDVKVLVDTVDTGIRIGYRLAKSVEWSVPSHSKLTGYVMAHLKGMFEGKQDCSRDAMFAAVDKLAPKDYRLLRELVAQNVRDTDAAKLLVGRVARLLEREIRRETLNTKIQKASRGAKVDPLRLQINEWYWIKTESGWRIHLFKSMSASATRLRFVDVDNNIPVAFHASTVEIMVYLPIAEAVSRAQKMFMTIELDHGTKFSYNTFMEFGSPESESSMRTRLRRLVSIVQLQCSEMDKARLNVLSEIKKHKGRSCVPQSTVVLGGGPTGLLIAVHCAQSVIMSGGVLRLYESRDAFAKQAATFERAQIVRLDSRWIAMMRYHLGTAYEDVYVPLSNETDPHLGNTIPGQGFVEVSIKRLEAMLLEEVVALHSRGLIKYYAGSKVDFNIKTDVYTKNGKDLKEEDSILLDGDVRKWNVKKFQHAATLSSSSELAVGHKYDLLVQGKIQKFALQEAEDDFYRFTSQQRGVPDITGSFQELPAIFPGGQGRVDPEFIVLQTSDSSGRVDQKSLRFDNYKGKKLQMDFSNSHVIISAGKPAKSDVHFKMSSTEPYGVCCIEGLQVSKGMHRFGQARWGTGLLDDIRSASDQNTRIVGDFTKTVKIEPIVRKMQKKLKTEAWKVYVGDIPDNDTGGPLPSIYQDLCEGVLELVALLPFKRDRLQTRFFELGDNYYLGMEFPREYDNWKTGLVPRIAKDLPSLSPDEFKKSRKGTQRDLSIAIDMLWYECTFEVMASGDVYNPGGKTTIPKLNLINSKFEMKLNQLETFQGFGFGREYRVKSIDGDRISCELRYGDGVNLTLPGQTWVKQDRNGEVTVLRKLQVGEIFNILDSFDILKKGTGTSLVRNSMGYITRIGNSALIQRRSDLARAPDGYSTSKVAIATFPVAHNVCHRCLTVSGNTEDEKFITAFVGDAQASPHFMRYSGLTGAGINAMAFNNLIAQSVAGTEFPARAQRYSLVTNWSNGEVVERGLGANYGEDGFLRPQCSYSDLVNYLYERALEFREMEAPLDLLLSRDWLTKFASALVPRGLETNAPFRDALISQLEMAATVKFEAVVTSEISMSSTIAFAIQQRIRSAFSLPTSSSSSRLDSASQKILDEAGITFDAVVDALRQIVDHSVVLKTNNRRLSSRLFTQPKPTDSIFDDLAVEAQSFAIGLTQGTAFTTGAISLALVSSTGGAILSSALGLLGISTSFGSMTNVSRYKNRNEEFRVLFVDKKLNNVKKGVFALLGKESMQEFDEDQDPFLVELDSIASEFKKASVYYNTDTSKVSEFEKAYKSYRHQRHDLRPTVRFMRRLVGEWIPITFYQNCYLQDHLVKMYKQLHEMLRLAQKANKTTVSGADELYRMILSFEPTLKKSLETGEIRKGFLKQRPLFQQSLFVTFRFLLSPIMPAACGNLLASTGKLLRKAENVRGESRDTLIKEIRDLKELHFATKESQVASMMFVSATIGFTTSTLFTVFRIIAAIGGEDREWISILLQIPMWGAFGSLLGALLAFFHFFRKIGHLLKLSWDMRELARQNKSARLVRRVTHAQIFLTLLRLIAVSAACVGLPWFVLVLNVFDGDIDLPRYVALGAVGMVLVSVFFFFIVEFGIRYNLDAQLGPVVCKPFARRLERMHKAFKTPHNGVDTHQMLDQDDWEYTAREFLHQYRFDTVFAADRFGAIQQWIQSGLMTADDYTKAASDDTSISV